MIVYHPVFDRDWKIVEIDPVKATNIGEYILYHGYIYGPTNELFTDREGAAAWIRKEYNEARKYQLTLEQAKEASGTMYSVEKRFRFQDGTEIKETVKTGMTYMDACSYCGDRGFHLIEKLPDGVEDEAPIGAPAYWKTHRLYDLYIQEAK